MGLLGWATAHHIDPKFNTTERAWVLVTEAENNFGGGDARTKKGKGQTDKWGNTFKYLIIPKLFTNMMSQSCSFKSYLSPYVYWDLNNCFSFKWITQTFVLTLSILVSKGFPSYRIGCWVLHKITHSSVISIQFCNLTVAFIRNRTCTWLISNNEEIWGSSGHEESKRPSRVIA